MSGGGGKPSCPSPSAGDLRELPRAGKNTGVGCHALLQGIFPTQGSNPGLQHCWQILYGLRHHTNPANALQDPCTWRSILLQCSDLSAAPGISQAPPTSKPWHPQTCDTSCLDDPLHTLPKGLCLDLISSEAPSLTTPTTGSLAPGPCDVSACPAL